MRTEFTTFIKSIYPLPEPVLEEVIACFQHWEYPKHYMLLKQERVCKYLYFITKGAVRYFYTDETGKETNVWFSFEMDIVADAASFIKQEPALESIQLLEDSEFFAVEHDIFQGLLKKHHAFALWYIKLIETYYAMQMEDRLSDLQFLSAKQRYEKLLIQFPNITNRISLGHIASYLNITQETLSRIRAGKM